MSNTLVMVLIFVSVGVFFYFSKKNAKKTNEDDLKENIEAEKDRNS